MSYYPGQRRGAQTITAIILFLVGIGLTIGLYYVKTRAQSSKQEVTRMERLVAAEKVALNVLKAEISHLESPARVAAFAESELGLKPTQTGQVVGLKELVERLPLSDPGGLPIVLTEVGVGPVASISRFDGASPQ